LGDFFVVEKLNYSIASFIIWQSGFKNIFTAPRHGKLKS